MHALTTLQVIGIDPNVQRLQVAREKYSAGNIIFKEGRAEDFHGSDFDVVFFNYVFHWCKEKDKVFEQVATSLKNGGKFGFVTPSNFIFLNLFCPVPEMISPECQQFIAEVMHIPTSEELHQLASSNGFVTSFTKERIQIWKFESVSKFVTEFLMIHFHKYGIEHYNVKLMKEYYGEEVVLKQPYTTDILTKV